MEGLREVVDRRRGESPRAGGLLPGRLEEAGAGVAGGELVCLVYGLDLGHGYGLVEVPLAHYRVCPAVAEDVDYPFKVWLELNKIGVWWCGWEVLEVVVEGAVGDVGGEGREGFLRGVALEVGDVVLGGVPHVFRGVVVGGVEGKVDGCYAFQGLAGGVQVGQGPGVVEPGIVQDDGDLLSLIGLALEAAPS